jgi:hypothetical protein
MSAWYALRGKSASEPIPGAASESHSAWKWGPSRDLCKSAYHVLERSLFQADMTAVSMPFPCGVLSRARVGQRSRLEYPQGRRGVLPRQIMA